MKKLISRKVLETELYYAITLINVMDFGSARTIIERALSRVKEYDLVPPKDEKPKVVRHKDGSRSIDLY